MDERSAVGDDPDARGHERVDDLADRLFIAGNGARRKDDGVAGGEFRGRMLVLRHAGERRARLALAAGGERQYLVARQALERVHAQERRHAVEHPALAGDSDDALYRSPKDQDVPAGGEAGLGRGAKAGDVGSEGGHDHPAPRLADQPGKRLGDVTLRRALAFAQDVGRIADERQHALVAERLEARLVGWRADDRRWVDLPVGGVENEAGGSSDRQRRAFGDGMGDRDELDDERADGDFIALGDDPQRNLGRARLAEPARLGESGRKARHIDGRAKVRPKFGERADVVLVRMGDDDADQILLRLLDETEVRHDEIDARQVLTGEGDAEIDHQPLARVFGAVAVQGAIHADLAQAAERDEHELAVIRHLGATLRRMSRQVRQRQGV